MNESKKTVDKAVPLVRATAAKLEVAGCPKAVSLALAVGALSLHLMARAAKIEGWLVAFAVSETRLIADGITDEDLQRIAAEKDS